MRKPFSTLTHNVIAMKNSNFCLIFSESELDTRIPNLLKLETTSDHPFYILAYFYVQSLFLHFLILTYYDVSFPVISVRVCRGNIDR